MARATIDFSKTTTELDILDLSTVDICSSTIISPIKRIQDHMKEKFPLVTEIKKVVSFGPLKHARDLELVRIFERFFPVWILLSLIPEDEKKCLTIGEIMVSPDHQYSIPSWAKRHPKNNEILEWAKTYYENDVIPGWLIKSCRELCIVFGKGCLKIERLIILNPQRSTYINGMRNELLQFGISCITCKLKIDITTLSKNYFDESRLRRLRIEPGDEFKFFRRYTQDEDKIPYISSLIEDLHVDIPCYEESESPHTMFRGGFCGNTYLNTQPNCKAGDGVLIATLGYGYDFTYFPAIATKNFASKTAPVSVSYSNSSFPLKIIDIAPKSDLVFCQTTCFDGTIVNGATAKAINWLQDKWNETWQKKYDNLVILIPYGGQYMEDEMIAIYKATDEGINIVCAAGDGGKVVFPAALGNVISVGVVNDKPNGREIDVFMRCQNNIQSNHKCDCSTAAALVTGLLSVLLSCINSIIKSSSKLTNPLSKEIADSIKRVHVRGYTHTCVIRELLINESNGKHCPWRGYGDGKELFQKLLNIDDDQLLSKMADVLLLKHPKPGKGTKPKNPKIIPITDENRDILYHGLTGQNIVLAVIDSDFPVPEEKPVPEENFDAKEKSAPKKKPILKEKSVPKEKPVPEENLDLDENPARKEKKEFHGNICKNIVYNVCPEAKVLSIKDLGCITQGINECCKSKENVSVISCSMGTYCFDLVLCKAVSEAIMAGKILVFSAGNEGQRFRNTISYPGRIGNVLVIGGRDPFNNPLNFSSVGRELDFLAPGELGRTVKGTSYAAPVIAGYIALLLEFIKRMAEEGYKITAWSMNPDTEEYEWRNISIWKAAHNVYAMRTLLKILVPKPQEHSETMGFGCVDLSTIFPSYRTKSDVKTLVSTLAMDKIHLTLQNFYRKQNTLK